MTKKLILHSLWKELYLPKLKYNPILNTDEIDVSIFQTIYSLNLTNDTEIDAILRLTNVPPKTWNRYYQAKWTSTLPKIDVHDYLESLPVGSVFAFSEITKGIYIKTSYEKPWIYINYFDSFTTHSVEDYIDMIDSDDFVMYTELSELIASSSGTMRKAEDVFFSLSGIDFLLELGNSYL